MAEVMVVVVAFAMHSVFTCESRFDLPSNTCTSRILSCPNGNIHNKMRYMYTRESRSYHQHPPNVVIGASIGPTLLATRTPCFCCPPLHYLLAAREEYPPQGSGDEDAEGDKLHCEECAVAPRGFPADVAPVTGEDRQPLDQNKRCCRGRGMNQCNRGM